MTKSATAATSLIVLLLALSPTATQAESIKDLVSDAELAKHCSTVGINTETTANVTLPDGTTATGTIHCEAEDLAVGSDDQVSDDINDVDEDSGDDNSGDDDGSDDEDTDEDSGSGGGDSSDEVSGDDHSEDTDNSDGGDDSDND